MRHLPTILALIVLFVAIAPVFVTAQEIPSVSYRVDVQQIVQNYGLADNGRFVTVNCPPIVTLDNPLAIMGSQIDTFERQGFNIYTSDNPFDQRTMLTDEAREFNGQNLDNYDLIVVGGPDHNKYTKNLIDRGIITYKQTDEKMPGLIIEVAKSPKGHTILVVGDTAGYPYHKKDLPLNGIIPEKYAPAAAVATGTIFGLIGILLGKLLTTFGSLWDKILNFVMGYLTTHAGEAASEKEAEARKVKVNRKKKGLFLGVSGKEMIVGLACAALFGIAYLIADRLGLLLDQFVLYLVVGGVVSVLHDFGHRLVAYIFKVPSEYKFWGIGTIIMLVTSWLFGTVFAQPGRFMIDAEEEGSGEGKEADPSERNNRSRKLALITLAGPVLSFVLCIAFVPLLFFGGIIAQIGLLGLSMNLVTVVYNLMPFSPMDGKSIWNWSKLFWALLFVPVFLFFIVMTVFVL